MNDYDYDEGVRAVRGMLIGAAVGLLCFWIPALVWWLW
jgi:hypothetical protein